MYNNWGPSPTYLCKGDRFAKGFIIGLSPLIHKFKSSPGCQLSFCGNKIILNSIVLRCIKATTSIVAASIVCRLLGIDYSWWLLSVCLNDFRSASHYELKLSQYSDQFLKTVNTLNTFEELALSAFWSPLASFWEWLLNILESWLDVQDAHVCASWSCLCTVAKLKSNKLALVTACPWRPVELCTYFLPFGKAWMAFVVYSVGYEWTTV